MVDVDRGTSTDLALAVEGPAGRLEPARIHAGGLAWIGESRLLVAATDAGLWEFDLADVRIVDGEDARRLVGSRRPGAGASGRAIVRTRVHDVPVRCSFVGRVFAADGVPLPRVVVGEYRTDESGRIAESDVPAPDAPWPPLQPVAPGISRMQGAVRFGNTTLVSQSNGMHPGALWAGSPESMVPSGRLPVGCEDLALDLDAWVVWTVAEHPGRRVVRATPLADLGI